MEEVYASQKAALDERERHLGELMEKSRVTHERTAFLQRQTLEAEIEAARIQIEKTRQSEMELERFVILAIPDDLRINSTIQIEKMFIDFLP